MRLLLLVSLLITLFAVIPSSAQTLTASVFFESNHSSLSPEQQAKLLTFLKSLDTAKVPQLRVSAYCDDRGSDAFNSALSLKRAGFIKQAIGTAFPDITVEAEGKGEIGLTNTGNPDTERSHNRRAEIRAVYTAKLQTPIQIPLEKPLVMEEPATVEKKAPIISNEQKVGDKITLENILFAGGRHILLPESYESLENLKNVLLEKQKYHIMILGHICCIRTGEDGMDFDTGIKNLSVARAKAVYNYLVQNGVSPDRLSYKGMRANYPTGKSDREDRRVEIEITKIVEK